MPIDTILQIGRIIHYDFSKDIKELSQIPNEYKKDTLQDISNNYENAAYWREKYFLLLEKHQTILESKLEGFINKHSK